VQLAETLPRDLPAPVRRWRDRVLAEASLVVARSPSAAALAEREGARGEVAVVAHDTAALDRRPEPPEPFTVAFVGRLVEDKGLSDLLAAVGTLDGVALVVAGAGPLAASLSRPGVTYLGPLRHDRVGEAFARAHVTCVPSRTTDRWEEQFGRVVVESLVRGVPVVATETGALPWVLATTGGGVLVAERDPAALAAAIDTLRQDPAATAALGAAGREGAIAAFSTEAVAAQLAALVARISPR
jgi:glycosyltransferase involved in cell wall biosynthesis